MQARARRQHRLGGGEKTVLDRGHGSHHGGEFARGGVAPIAGQHGAALLEARPGQVDLLIAVAQQHFQHRLAEPWTWTRRLSRTRIGVGRQVDARRQAGGAIALGPVHQHAEDADCLGLHPQRPGLAGPGCLPIEPDQISPDQGRGQLARVFDLVLSDEGGEHLDALPGADPAIRLHPGVVMSEGLGQDRRNVRGQAELIEGEPLDRLAPGVVEHHLGARFRLLRRRYVEAAIDRPTHRSGRHTDSRCSRRARARAVRRSADRSPCSGSRHGPAAVGPLSAD